MKPRQPGYQKERGERQKRRIVAACGGEPLTAQQIAEALFMSAVSVRRYLPALLEKPRLIHVAGWERTGSRPAALYAAGVGRDAPFSRARKQRKTPSADTQLETVAKLLEAPMTSHAVGKALGVTTNRARFYICMLRKQKKVRITEWWPSEGSPIPVYVQGNQPDRPRPKRMTRAEIYKQDKADAEKNDYLLARRRMLNAEASAKRKPKGIFAALGI